MIYLPNLHELCRLMSLKLKIKCLSVQIHAQVALCLSLGEWCLLLRPTFGPLWS